MKKIDSDELLKFLKKRLESEVVDEWDSAFTESGPPTGEITQKLVGSWACIKAVINYNGTTMDPSTDRASGDPEDVHAWYDWVGSAKTVPTKVSRPEELDNWAHLATYYRLTFRDVQYPGPFGHHEGRLLWKFTEDGIAEVCVVVNKRFQDVSPKTMTKIEIIDLNKIKK